MFLVKVPLEMVRILSFVAANVTFVEWRVFMDVFSVPNELAFSLADKVTVSASETLAVAVCNLMSL